MNLTRHYSVKKQTRTVKSVLSWYLIGCFLFSYLGLLCGATWVSGNSFGEFLNQFVEFVIKDHHYLVGVTAATPKFILSYLFGWTLGYILWATQYEHPYAGEEYGHARWGNAKEFSKQFADHNDENRILVNTGDVKLNAPLYVNCANYWLAEDVYLSINNVKTANLNMLVVGPPGSGKSFRLARPILSQLCGNFVVTDPKGELYKQTGQFFEDNGYEVMVMNVESEEAMPMSIHFNPFRYIRNESDILSIANILIKSTTDPDSESNSDPFFEQSAEVLLTALIYLIHYYYPREEQTWRTFVKLLDATTVFTKKDGSIDNRAGGIMDIEKRAQLEWKKSHDTDFPGYISVEKFYHGAAETTSSIVASLDAHCRYMKLACVVDLLSEDEIQIADSFGYSKPTEDCSTGKRILFMVTSEDKRYYDWIPSMVYSLFFDELYHLTAMDPSLKEALPNHLTFLMDEFSNVTLPDSFVGKLSTMRSRNISAVIIVQNLIQLKRKFPKFDMDKDLIGNCSIIHILGAPDMDSCEYLSKHFGTQTIRKASDSDSKDHKGSSSRSEDVMEKPLFSPEDIFAMKKDGECAIVVKGTEPLYQTKCRMEYSPFVKLLCRKENPYNPSIKREMRLRRKSLDASGSFILTGDDARKKAQELRQKGVKVIRVTDADIDALNMSANMNLKEPTLPFTEQQKKQMEENYRRYKANREPFDYSILKEGLSAGDEMEYALRCNEIRKLEVAGFKKGQLKALVPLVKLKIPAEEILKLFQVDSKEAEIADYTDKVNISSL